jgi:integrase
MRLSHQVSRPVATAERYKRLKAVASELPPAFGVLLDLAWHTGHRIGAVLTLRWEDISFDQTTDAPFGTIRWYAGVMSDRKKHEHTLPMNEQARSALLAFRKLNFPPKGWLFGSEGDRTQRMPKWGPKKWLNKAERLADLPHLKMGGWHIFRRGWASARKHMPLKDVARAGGWSETDTTTLTKCYQHADQDTTLQAATFIA